MEVRGYAEQAKVYVNERGYTQEYALYLCATWLSNHTNLRWTYDDAHAALVRELSWDDVPAATYNLTLDQVVTTLSED